ncbi:FixH family protein [Allobacillus sp. GCM10007491]|uniref:FixH family protein n=1 Tax=Allobacillus saliphilus TaxID=2912308 RepID=A0A941CVH7_9BACI|nr:FixH family protein [Allobacillus saliphilus]MBR7553964.1 FixH family protein [Allobacillus saliphilus]
MNKILQVVFWIASLLLFTACGDDQVASEDEITPMNKVIIEIQMDNEMNVGQHNLKSQIYYEGKPLKETEQMMFEIWMADGEGDREVVKGEHQGEGIYTAGFHFDRDGLYYVQARVDAKDEHVQTKMKIDVGDTE